jgi:predicted aminopeptidase
MGVGRTGHRPLGIAAVMARRSAIPGMRALPVHIPGMRGAGLLAASIRAATTCAAGIRTAGARASGVRKAAALCLMTGALAGCSSIGGFTGAAAGIATGAATTNPAIGVGVGVAVQAATDAAVQRVYRNMQDTEQTLIARAAGNMTPGEKRVWAAHYAISFFDEHGEVQVLNQTQNALTACREVAFSVISGKGDAATSQWFITQVCRGSDEQWRWAAAEPAVGRWGTLQ